MRACKCPNCGANLNFDEAPNNYVYCQYCGTKIDLLDQRTMHTEHIIDDAKLKDAEAKMKNAETFSRVADIFASPFEAARDKRLAEEAMERQLKEEARIQREKASEARANFAIFFVTSIGKAFRYIGKHPKDTIVALAIIVAVGSGASFAGNVYTAHKAASTAARMEMGEVQYPDISSSTVDYRDIQKALRDAGFTNISLVPVRDLRPTEYYRENRIVEVTVDGAPTAKKNDWYSANTPIVIKYHALKEGAVANSSTVDALADAASDAQDALEDAFDSAVESLLGSLSDSKSRK